MDHTMRGTGWREVFLGGSRDAEEKIFDELSARINAAQRDNLIHSSWSNPERGQHAKTLAGISQAEICIAPNLPSALTIGFFQPGKSYKSIVRFSNADGLVRSDAKPDLRGIAIRVFFDDHAPHDFLLTNAAHSHAKNVIQFVIASSALARHAGSNDVVRLVGAFFDVARELHSLPETTRLFSIVLRQALRSKNKTSLVTQDYWSRAPFQIGEFAVKFILRHTNEEKLPASQSLRDDLQARLAKGTVAFDFQVQRFVDEAMTPIEDARKEWSEKDAPPDTIAQLFIPQQQLDEQMDAHVHTLEFNPWNNLMGDFLLPLGNMNRARKRVYEASVKLRKHK